MAEVAPFRAITYNSEKAGALESCVAPPYDVISPTEQDALYAAGPNNYVRVILNRTEPGDDANAPYRRAASFLDEWLASGVLQEDPSEGFYLYRQEFTNPADGHRYSRTGVFVALKLEPYSAGVVLPHEETRTKAKDDRLRLMRVTKSNPEPIYALYEDPNGEMARQLGSVAASPPDLSVTVDGDLHEIRRISNPAVAQAFQQYLADRRVWIADGHHRYETALTFSQEAGANLLGAGYVLTVLSAFEDPGLIVLPTHRLVRNVSAQTIAGITQALAENFEVSAADQAELEKALSGAPKPGEHQFGLVMPGGTYLLKLRDESVMDDLYQGKSTDWKRLDVTILQALVLEKVFGIPAAELATTPDIAYTRDWNEALASVQGGEFQAALLLANPTAVEVRRVAAAGDKMPPKSTFFYPKLWSGLILRKL